MRPYPPKGPESHPGGKHHQVNLNSNLTAIHPSLFPELKERDSPPIRLCPNLHMEQSLLTNLIFSIPPSKKHLGNTRPGRANRIIAAPNPSIFHRTCERPAAGNDDTSYPVDGIGLPVKGGSGQAAGPEVSHPQIK